MLLASPTFRMASDYKRIPSAEQKALFDRVVARSKAVRGQPVPVVVFDLDGTVLDNRPRTINILQELAADLRAEAATLHGNADEGKKAAEILAAARAEHLAYLMTDSLRKLGIVHPDLVARADAFWKTRFFSDAYLKHDVEVPGSIALSKACYEAGATLVYFTGRDLPNMALGSFQSLRDLGFPIGVIGTELVCKPDFAIPDAQYKREEGAHLARLGTVVCALENEPGNCNAFQELFPQADVVFVDTQHFPDAPALDARVHIVGDLVR